MASLGRYLLLASFLVPLLKPPFLCISGALNLCCWSGPLEVRSVVPSLNARFTNLEIPEPSHPVFQIEVIVVEWRGIRG